MSAEFDRENYQKQLTDAFAEWQAADGYSANFTGTEVQRLLAGGASEGMGYQLTLAKGSAIFLNRGRVTSPGVLGTEQEDKFIVKITPERLNRGWEFGVKPAQQKVTITVPGIGVYEIDARDPITLSII